MADEYQECADDAYRADCAALVVARDEVLRLRSPLARAEAAHAAAHERVCASAARVSREVRVRRVPAPLSDEWCTHDVVERIFSASAGDVRTLCALACVCRAFRDAARNPGLWTHLRFMERRAPTLAEEQNRVGKLTDERLLALAARGGGQLIRAELHSCRALTYAGVKRLMQRYATVHVTLRYCELPMKRLGRLAYHDHHLPDVGPRLKADGVPLTNDGRAACLPYFAQGDFEGAFWADEVSDDVYKFSHILAKDAGVCPECMRLVGGDNSLGCGKCKTCRLCFEMLHPEADGAPALSLEDQNCSREHCCRRHACNRCAEHNPSGWCSFCHGCISCVSIHAPAACECCNALVCSGCWLHHGTHYIPLPLEPLIEPRHAVLVRCGSVLECEAVACVGCVGSPEMPACADCGTAFCASCAAEGALCRPTRSYDTDARDEVFCRSCLEARGLPSAASDDDDDETEPQPRSAACSAGPSAALLKATRPAQGPLEARQLLAKRRGRA